MNGAESAIHTLVGSGIDVCFTNPGTSEMHLVAALDAVPQMRAILGLSEGVVTGAADGYARIAGSPAATLLHLGPGLANGLANLHNARRARSPVVTLIGDHATYHKQYDAPLESDIDSLAGSLQGWVRRSGHSADVGADIAAAAAAATDPPGTVASVILPADTSWGDGGTAVEAIPARAPQAPAESTVATGATPLVETFPARLQRGAGLPTIDRLGYRPEQAAHQLDGAEHIILAGSKSPATFFAYPDKASDLVPDGARVHTLARPAQDVVQGLEALADLLAPEHEPVVARPGRPELPGGPLTPQNWVEVIGAVLPEEAIISDEANTSGLLLPAATAGAPRHDLLTLTGGAIGQGMPVATGAAIAAAERPVINLQSDGSAMYTISALWTQARENLDVTTVLLNNGAYAILRLELQGVGGELSGQAAKNLFDLARPAMDFCAMAQGMGVPASRATTAEELAEQFARALAEPGPHLIEAQVPPLV